MLNALDRNLVERVKNAQDIEITINGGGKNFLHLTFSKDTRKLAHDIGLAIQDYFAKNS